jgi:hypothetical protein
MIDFRYHVVSLVSVFIALAVGIVLGAGPLRGQIAEQLSQRVDQLVVEKNTLRTERDVAVAGVRNRDAFTAQLVPQLVSGRLTARSVVLISLPGADADAVEPLSAALQAAGASVGGRVEIRDNWIAPGKADARSKLAQEWAKVLSTPSQALTRTPSAATQPSRTPATRASSGAVTAPGRAGGEVAQTLQALLVRAVVTANPLEAGQDDPVGRQVLDALSGAGMIAVKGKIGGRASLAVLLTPPVVLPVAGQPSPTASSADVSAQWSALGLALDRGSIGTVAVGPASAATTGGVLAALRTRPEDRRQVSTVDSGGSPMGDVTTVYALQEQVRGSGGAYGFGKDAAAPLPTATGDGGQ